MAQSRRARVGRVERGEEGGGAAFLFLPEVEEIYPRGPEKHLRIVIPELDGILEGASRPGHFSGVAAVVAKLFLIISPHCALFGRKDLQQLYLIRALVRDLCLPLEIIAAPTVRAPDGLALSSRNRYLSPDQRQVAALLYRQLCTTRDALLQNPTDAEQLCQEAMERLRDAGFQPDYFSLRDKENLGPPRADSRQYVLLAAASLGNTRLIDNVTVALQSPPVSETIEGGVH